MLTKCNRCHHPSERKLGESCGETDAWNEHPCNGILIENKRRATHNRHAMRAAISHLHRLENYYANDVQQHRLIEVRRDIKRLEKML